MIRALTLACDAATVHRIDDDLGRLSRLVWDAAVLGALGFIMALMTLLLALRRSRETTPRREVKQ